VAEVVDGQEEQQEAPHDVQAGSFNGSVHSAARR